MTEFFRHCPGCGRRFHVKLESKRIIESHTETIRTHAPSGVTARTTGRGAVPAFNVVTLTEGKPIILDVEEFRYNYKCGHCGHEWSEERTEEHRLKSTK